MTSIHGKLDSNKTYKMNIQIEHLKKNFGEKTAVDIGSFKIADGTMLGLVGNNGAGKTTLFRLLLDLIKRDAGTIAVSWKQNDQENGDMQTGGVETVDPAESEDWKLHTGAYIDDGFLIDFLMPEEYFDFLGRIYNLSSEELQGRLEMFEHFMNGEVLGQKKLIRNLSAGNKQKVGIVGALIGRPKLLILDEPFNFLDPSSQSQLKHLLTAYNEEEKATILISSHNLQHTVDICPRIALMEHGIILKDLQNEGGSAEKELEDYFNV